ncbi:putative MFS family arabinose efflux permease [Herbihabitans rhizosphaerae]|uniref:Putative MFS family arabinose efflux permease n=1 Tax=Herbihabitans rhizosphaerae TaxID=1872711 RepID=A0A4Q7KW53_9PSEU|nr:MFS transporter [Herbihabitans rhizosphaerae]RZS41288.1 putative MFS family arabinose efflux permease [Herbihabitans rhizosphaerae]
MSHSASLADYRTALTAPGARGPVIGALFGRMPIAMVGLSLLFYVQRETGSFAIAGLVSAGALVGVATGAVAQGRIADRIGPTRPLLVVVAALALFVTLAVIAIESHAPTPVLIAVAFGVGLTEPGVGAASRALWATLVPAGPVRHAAYAYEAISMEVFFILGPAFAGLLADAPWAGTGVVLGSAVMIAGGTFFALTPAVRAVRPEPHPDRRLLGALSSPGMVTLALAAGGFGVVVGFVEVAVPAVTTMAGEKAYGGMLLAIWSVSSVIFGVAYGTRPWPREMHLRLPVLLGGFAIMVSLLAVPGTLWGLTIAMIVVGTLITPQATAHSTAIELVAPNGTATEAFGWIVTSVTLGLAAGQSMSGYLVEHHSPDASFLAATLAGLLIAAVVWARRGTVAAGVPAPAAVPVSA